MERNGPLSLDKERAKEMELIEGCSADDDESTSRPLLALLDAFVDKSLDEERGGKDTLTRPSPMGNIFAGSTPTLPSTNSCRVLVFEFIFVFVFDVHKTKIGLRPVGRFRLPFFRGSC